MRQRPRVLLVEDDVAQRELLSARFRKAGYPITTASEVSEALGIAERQEIDLLVLDQHLPGMSGLDFLRSTRDQTPVILLSGAWTPAMQEEALKEGASSILPKPFRWPDLEKAVERALESKQKRLQALVVDDHAPTCELLKKILSGEGYDVVTAGDGKEALEKATRSSVSYDLLITDILMPKLNGPDLIRSIKDRCKGSRIVFTTGAASRDQIRECYELGGASLWRKPFDLKKVRTELTRFKTIPPEVQQAQDMGAFATWLEGFRKELSRNKRLKLGLRGAMMLALAGLIGITLLGSFLHFQGLLGPALDRVGGFMDRVEGYLERDESREMELERRNQELPR